MKSNSDHGTNATSNTELIDSSSEAEEEHQCLLLQNNTNPKNEERKNTDPQKHYLYPNHGRHQQQYYYQDQDKSHRLTVQQYIMRTVRSVANIPSGSLSMTPLSKPVPVSSSCCSTSQSASKGISRQVSMVLLVLGLLVVEYTLQNMYYQHLQRRTNPSSKQGIFDTDKLAAISVPKSQQFLKNLDLETCKFPLFFDKSHFDWKLKDNAFVSPGDWRERNQKYVGLEDAGNVYHRIRSIQRQRYEARKKARDNGEPYHRLTRRNITFVHIGKAGGSTIACNLREGHRYIQQHCDNIDYDEIESRVEYDSAEHGGRPYIPESVISLHVNCYTHWRMHLKCFYLQGDHPFAHLNTDETNMFFGSRVRRQLSSLDHHHHQHYQQKDHYHSSPSTIRHNKEEPFRGNQYSRGASVEPASTQDESSQHRTQEPYPGNDYLLNLRSPIDRIASWFVYEHAENHEVVYADRPYHCGQVVLSSCYQHFEHLTTVGLSFPRPSQNQPLKVGTNLSAAECSHWAWAAIQGSMPVDYHNAYNYAWYAHRLLHDEANEEADIFVLRVEHLEQDWTTVDTLLGGDGSFPATMASKQNSASIKPLRIANHNTTDIGIQNLCRALCEEIQVYKQLLLRAVNLQPADLDISMEELRQQCPDEVDIWPRKCHYD